MGIAISNYIVQSSHRQNTKIQSNQEKKKQQQKTHIALPHYRVNIKKLKNKSGNYFFPVYTVALPYSLVRTLAGTTTTTTTTPKLNCLII